MTLAEVLVVMIAVSILPLSSESMKVTSFMDTLLAAVSLKAGSMAVLSGLLPSVMTLMFLPLAVASSME